VAVTAGPEWTSIMALVNPGPLAVSDAAATDWSRDLSALC